MYMKNFVEELRWRGMLQNSTPGIEEELAKDPNFKYSLEETTGHVNNYGDLIVDIIEEN